MQKYLLIFTILFSFIKLQSANNLDDVKKFKDRKDEVLTYLNGLDKAYKSYPGIKPTNKFPIYYLKKNIQYIKNTKFEDYYNNYINKKKAIKKAIDDSLDYASRLKKKAIDDSLDYASRLKNDLEKNKEYITDTKLLLGLHKIKSFIEDLKADALSIDEINNERDALRKFEESDEYKEFADNITLYA